MLFWGLIASDQMTLRRVDDWQTSNRQPSEKRLDPTT
jgi:hypothetical protein